MTREDYESVGEVVHDLINPVLARLHAIAEDHQWLLPEKRAAVNRLLVGIDAAWVAYWKELYGSGKTPQFTERGEIRETDNGPTPADIAGEVQHDIG